MKKSTEETIIKTSHCAFMDLYMPWVEYFTSERGRYFYKSDYVYTRDRRHDKVVKNVQKFAYQKWHKDNVKKYPNSWRAVWQGDWNK